MPEVLGIRDDLPVLCAIPCFYLAIYPRIPNCLGCGGYSECFQNCFGNGLISEFCFSLSALNEPYPITILCNQSSKKRCLIGLYCCQLSCSEPEHSGPNECFHSDCQYCCLFQNSGLLCDDIPHMCVIFGFMINPEIGCLKTEKRKILSRLYNLC